MIFVNYYLKEGVVWWQFRYNNKTYRRLFDFYKFPTKSHFLKDLKKDKFGEVRLRKTIIDDIDLMNEKYKFCIFEIGEKIVDKFLRKHNDRS